MSDKENVIVLSGTKWQIPLITKLKEKGYRVIDFNLLPESPAFQYSDEYRVIDILDFESCLKCAKQFSPTAIMSDECDIATRPIAYLSEELGLISIGSEMAELYTNKYLMRCFGKENNFATPRFFKCQTLNQAIEIFHEFGEKMILKPIDSNSSRGVYTIKKEEELIEHFSDTLSYSKAEKSVLLEEYIDGVEFTIDGIKTEKGHISLAISEKRHYEYNPNIACSLYFSHSNKLFDYEELKKINDKFVELSGLSFGLTHAEYKYKDGKFYLIEIGARGGGNLISAVIVPLVSGVDNYEYLIDKTMGKECNEDIRLKKDFKNRCAILQFFDTEGKEGVIKEIKGKEILENCQRIVDYCIYYHEGEKVVHAQDDSKRIGYYIAYGESEQELKDIIDKIENSFKIIVEET